MKKRCSSSRGPSQDVEEEQQQQHLGQMSIPISQKAADKSTEYLLYSEYFKNIATEPEETLKNILAQNGVTYSPKDKETYSSILNFRYKDTTLESLNLQVTLGCFQTDISIFLINMPHDFCGVIETFAKGAFGQVALMQF